MNFIKTEDTALIAEFRKELYRRFTTAIDGMWEAAYIASAQAYLVEDAGLTIGYCCIDSKKNLVQIFLRSEYNDLMTSVVHNLIELKLISSAQLSSIDPISFNACLFHSKSIQTNTFCFQYSNKQSEQEPVLNLELVSKEDSPGIITYFKNQIGFDDNFGYTENLVERKELYMIKDSENIIATGECRLSDSQPDFADLGVIINKAHQRKGLGSKVLYQLAQKAQKAKRQPVCSTTHDNIASKKAIEKAGFYCSHIIFDIHFTDR